MKQIYLMRHAKTPGNIVDPDLGVKFLGRKNDVSIIPPKEDNTNQVIQLLSHVTSCYTSPAKRCKETSRLVYSGKLNEDPLLHEIDYGDVDGLYLKQVQQQYSYLFDGWSQGKDPKFPNGENSQDVLHRYNDFIKSIEDTTDESILVCSHNVLMRCAVGNSFDIPMSDWVKISIPHFEPIQFTLQNGSMIYNDSSELRDRLLKNFD